MKKSNGQLCGSCIHLEHCAQIYPKMTGTKCCFNPSFYRKDARRPLTNYLKRKKEAEIEKRRLEAVGSPRINVGDPTP